MGVTNVDVEMFSLIRYYWKYVVQDHPELLDEIFESLRDNRLWKEFGDQRLKQIKEWFANNEVKVRQMWKIQATDIPSIAISLASSNEDLPKAFLGDIAGVEEIANSEETLVPYFEPSSNEIALENDETKIIRLGIPGQQRPLFVGIRPGHLIAIPDGNQFTITAIDDAWLEIEIPVDDDPDLSKIRVIHFSPKRFLRGQAWFYEQVDVIIQHRADMDVIIWIYAVLMYIFFRFKLAFEERGIQVHTWTVSDIYDVNEKQPSRVYARRMRFRCRVPMSWREEEITAPAKVFAVIDDDQGTLLASTITREEADAVYGEDSLPVLGRD